MSKNIALQILLNITFILMITCSKNPLLSKRAKTPINKITSENDGSFTISDDHINMKNSPIRKEIKKFISLPHIANLTGNGTYKITNSTNGNSVEVRIEEVGGSSNMKNNMNGMKKITDRIL